MSLPIRSRSTCQNSQSMAGDFTSTRSELERGLTSRRTRGDCLRGFFRRRRVLFREFEHLSIRHFIRNPQTLYPQTEFRQRAAFF